MLYGWSNTVPAFLEVSRSEWLKALRDHYPKATQNQSAPSSQVSAWSDCFDVLQVQFTELIKNRKDAQTWTCIFEYELPREGGRRPDLVLLAGGSVLVLEFKEKDSTSQADVDQVSAYARDLRQYHKGSHNRPVIPVLVPTKSLSSPVQVNDVWIAPPAHLATELSRLVPVAYEEPIDPHQWAEADYEPLPFLIDAARHIFNHDPLPYIRRAYAEAQIPAVLQYIASVARKAVANGERHLVLLTGAPGAGKTLVGLQFVHQYGASDSREFEKTAVFLSGNGPLIQVLQHVLRSSIFVQEVHHFVKHYGVRQPDRSPAEHILVFDEAQRAWSHDQMVKKQNISESEPDIFVRIAERLPQWSVVIGLIGEGQEIHVGEEAGLAQWNSAIQNGIRPWHVHTPPGVDSLFSAASSTEVTQLLNLSTSLRTHMAREVQLWVGAVLAGEVANARQLSTRIRREGFGMYVTQSLEVAKAYATERYQRHPAKRYGLLASSKPSTSVVDKLGVPRDFQSTQRLKYGPWYNDPPTSKLSCCQLDSAVTEFGCQGLELDMPIICWGDDVWWERGSWKASLLPKAADDPYQLRLNAYRVLLSRGRDGFVVWVPPVPKLHETYLVLLKAGATELGGGGLALGAD